MTGDTDAKVLHQGVQSFALRNAMFCTGVCKSLHSSMQNGGLPFVICKMNRITKTKEDMFREVRRKDRLWDTAEAARLLETGEYGFLSMVGTDGFGYGIPISFVKSGNSLYFHCAPEGYKLDCLRENPRVSFCVVGKTRVVPHQFTTAYESVHLFGTVQLDLSDEERRRALRLLVKKYSPEYEEIGEKYIEKSFHRTHILRLDIEHLSGKCKRIKGIEQ